MIIMVLYQAIDLLMGDKCAKAQKLKFNERQCDMRSKTVLILLLILSFNILHDSFIAIVEQNGHTGITHYVDGENLSPECDELNEIHNMFHFMAIITTHYEKVMIPLKKERLTHYLLQYSPPHTQTSYKPPIV